MKLLESVRVEFEAAKKDLSPEQAKAVDRCVTAIEEEAKEKEPSGSVIKSMGEKLVKVVEVSAKAAGLAEAANKLWELCQQWV